MLLHVQFDRKGMPNHCSYTRRYLGWVGSLVFHIHECVATGVQSSRFTATIPLCFCWKAQEFQLIWSIYSHSQLNNSSWQSLSDFLPRSYLVWVAWLLAYSVPRIVRLRHTSSYQARWHSKWRQIVTAIMSSLTHNSWTKCKPRNPSTFEIFFTVSSIYCTPSFDMYH